MTQTDDTKALLKQLLAVQILNHAELARINTLLAQNADDVPDVPDANFLSDFADKIAQERVSLQRIIRNLPAFEQE